MTPVRVLLLTPGRDELAAALRLRTDVEVVTDEPDVVVIGAGALPTSRGTSVMAELRRRWTDIRLVILASKGASQIPDAVVQHFGAYLAADATPKEVARAAIAVCMEHDQQQLATRFLRRAVVV